MKIINGYIIQFADGQYFTGVKSKMVRKTVHFKDAKHINLSNFEDSRDYRYLQDYKYKILKVEMTMQVIKFID